MNDPFARNSIEFKGEFIVKTCESRMQKIKN
jgi:hypothetical protein